ncbi:SGNH/GDSL hydrolase family protein [Desertibaculum subflavum]|uniref:SGNH/GDSL hydrolase family protein n=1 Tax=Desertibaculum subflavum TaxID=2268458 RepID=UPI000E6754E0
MSGRRLAAAIVLATAMAVAGPAAVAGTCDAPADDTFIAFGLPRVAAKLKAREPVAILVLGTASSLDYGTDPAGRAYPARLLTELRKLRPVPTVTVVNRSIRQETAAAMIKRFDQEIAATRPDLVIWQTGSTDAVSRVGVSEFGDALGTGIDLVHRRDVDLLFVTPQFMPQAAAVSRFGDYVDYMEQVAQSRRVPLLNRYDIMRHWSESGAIAMDPAGKPEKLKLIDTVQACVAEQLARAIAAAVSDDAPEGRDRTAAKR